MKTGAFKVQEKNYTNPEDRGRFGFSMSGEYRAPYKAEAFVVTLLVGVAVIAGLALFFTLSAIWQRNEMEQDSTSAFVLIGSIIALIVFVIILIVVFGVGIRNIKKGFLCKYSANDETFTTTIGGDLHVIQYKDVIGVTFQPRSSLGKIRGYNVIVRVGTKEEVFGICSDGYLSPQATPFYIIQERMEILRRPRSTTQVNTLRADSKAITKAEIERAQSGSVSAMDKMAQLLGETSNMPELSVSQSYSERAVEQVNQMMREYSSNEMPAVGEKNRTPDTYIGMDGREHPNNEVQAQGIFYIKPSRRKLILTAVISFFGSLGLALLILYVLCQSVFVALLFVLIPVEVVYAASFIIAVFMMYHFTSRAKGPLFNYRADGRGFYLTSKAGNSQILYKDVLSVDYTATKFLWTRYGFKVDILTTYGLITYDYIYPHFGHTVPTQFIPFDVLRRNIPKKEQNDK